ncbi:MAG: Na/Pi cotransporter family protein [Acutalibacteraceae bacterium]|nr:Na/Pi cotransporter family protein [Acutalibacteraceae bacterium]
MDVFSIITLFGGLAFFLYGMKVMSDGLEKSSGGSLNKNLKKVTQNRFIAMLFGAGMTIAVQSSSAVTVMLVGLVNSGILEFGQTIGVLMGSNIGTTLTAWILSLAGIDSDIVWVNLLKPSNFSPVLAFIGILMIMVGKKEKRKDIGSVLVGFSVLMFGMNLMSGAMEPLGEMPEFASILTAFKNPLLSVAVGAVFTGIIQSSAASVAILQALSMTGGITYGIAIPIIMGQNIGTCVTAVISSIGVSRNAKKVAVVHFSFNVLGTLICLIPFCIGNMIFRWAFVETAITPFMIAIVHTIFNVVTTAILLPFSKQLEKLANKVIPDKEEKHALDVILDERLLAVPTVAVEKSLDVVRDMCVLSENAFEKAMGLLGKYDGKTADEILEAENEIDRFEDKLGTYMMRLSKIGVSESDSRSIAKILHTIDDFERIGDHAVNLLGVAKEMHEKEIVFSDEANAEIAVLTSAIAEIMKLTSEAFRTGNVDFAKRVEPLEQVIDDLIMSVKRNHITRLRGGNCTIQLGFVLSDLLTNYERVSDHCSNIAVAVIESGHGTFEAHEYLETVKDEHNKEFEDLYKEYGNIYKIKA